MHLVFLRALKVQPGESNARKNIKCTNIWNFLTPLDFAWLEVFSGFFFHFSILNSNLKIVNWGGWEPVGTVTGPDTTWKLALVTGVDRLW
jgi:hypothetical protein